MLVFYLVESNDGGNLEELLGVLDNPTAAIGMHQSTKLEPPRTSRRVLKLLHHRQSAKIQKPSLKKVKFIEEILPFS